MSEIKIHLSENLRFLRNNKRKNQERMAAEFGLKRITYSKYEEDTSTPKIITLIKMSRYFKISIDDLLTKNLVK